MYFEDFIDSVQKKIKRNQSTVQVVREKDVVKALLILNFIQYQNVEDVFLGCASLNILDAYVRQPTSLINHSYRKHIYNIIKGVEDVKLNNNLVDLKVYYNNESHMIFIVLGTFQFRFYTKGFQNKYQQVQNIDYIINDGFTKQKSANSIFHSALSNDMITNKTLNGMNLLCFVDDEIKLFETGNYYFEDGFLKKEDNYQKEYEKIDPLDKNYYRSKLLNCQDRPVIFTGKFSKIYDKHITFIWIRPYIKGVRTLTICNHINLLRTDVEKIYDIYSLIKKGTYFIIGRCVKYPNSNRMGVKLDMSIKPSPLIKKGSYTDLPDDIIAKCHRFDIMEFERKTKIEQFF